MLGVWDLRGIISKTTRANAGATEGDVDEVTNLLPLVYERLRKLAQRYLDNERGYQTLQPTALVHEAFLRLVGIDRMDWKSKTHLFAVAATQMRRILVERARKMGAKKRGGRPRRVTLKDGLALTEDRLLDVLALEQALNRLAKASPRQAQVAEMRIFAGLGMREMAHSLEVSESTVRNDWRVARAWLATELRPPGGSPA